jgi:proteasome lid subunit RPN8/RPN11
VNFAETVWHAIEECLVDAGGREIGGFTFTQLDGSQVFRRIPSLGGFTEFIADPAVLDAIVEQIESRGGTINAFIHSHPVGTTPSRTDQVGASRSKWPWIIVTTHPEKAWAYVEAGRM